MKVVTLSFELRGDKMALSGSERASIILKVIKKERPKLLVTSGYSLETNKDLENLIKKLKGINNNSWILVEVKEDDNIIDNHPLTKKYPEMHYEVGNHNLYLIDDNNSIKNIGPQYFATRDEISGRNNPRGLEFEQALKSREFSIGDKRVIPLICGEINAIRGRDNITFVSEVVEKIIEQSDIVLNPTHDIMANYGTMKNKRKFLSVRNGKEALYINTANWNTGKARKQNPKTNRHMQNVYLNGNMETTKTCYALDEGYVLNIAEIDF